MGLEAIAACLLKIATPNTFDFTQDSKEVIVSYPGKLLIFDTTAEGASSPRETMLPALDTATSWTLRIHPNGKLIAAGSGERTNLLILDVHTGQSVMSLPHNEGIFAMAWSADGKYFSTADYRNVLHIWDPITGKELKRLPSNQTVRLEFDPQGDIPRFVRLGWENAVVGFPQWPRPGKHLQIGSHHRFFTRGKHLY